MKTFRSILFGVGLSVLASGLASATTLTQTFTLNQTPTDITGTTGTGTFSDFLTLCPSCSASWLTSVQLQITVTEDLSSLSVTNGNSAPQTFTYSTYSFVDSTGTGADVAALDGDFSNTNFAASNGCVAVTGGSGHPGQVNLCNTGSQTYAANQTINYVTTPVAASTTTGLQNAASIAPYDTTGTFTIGFLTSTNQNFNGGGGNDTNAQTTTAGGVVTVLYNYTVPVVASAPEPATLFLMGSALVGIGLFRKRIKS